MLSAVPLGPPIYIHPTAADFYNTAHRADSSSKYVSHLVFYLLNFSCLLYFFFFPPRFCFSPLLLLSYCRIFFLNFLIFHGGRKKRMSRLASFLRAPSRLLNARQQSLDVYSTFRASTTDQKSSLELIPPLRSNPYPPV